MGRALDIANHRCFAPSMTACAGTARRLMCNTGYIWDADCRRSDVAMIQAIDCGQPAGPINCEDHIHLNGAKPSIIPPVRKLSRDSLNSWSS